MLPKSWPGPKGARDLSFIDIDQEKILVVACDSAGAIGPKPGDQLQVPGEVIGRFTTRVALMEVLAVGAKPVSIINTLAVEYDPTGKEIIQGIRAEAARLGLDDQVQINGSTEENFPTSQTGIGVTVLGMVQRDGLRVACSQEGDLVLAIGLPLVGGEVLQQEELIPELMDVVTLLEMEEVHELIPVGSKGIAYEMDLLATMSGLSYVIENDLQLELSKSAGPASTVLVSVGAEDVELVQKKLTKPVTVIGRLK